MRDWWYEQVKKIYPDNRLLLLIEEINTKLDKIQQGQMNLDELKPVLTKVAYDTINRMTLGTAVNTASGIVSASAVESPFPSPFSGSLEEPKV